MAKKTFETVLKWNGGEAFRARVEVGADGWGRVLIRLTVCTAAQ